MKARETSAEHNAVAVLIPCRDEAATIGAVVGDFARALAGAAVLVCDNASGDETARLAAAAGATVIAEPRPGKGQALGRLFEAFLAGPWQAALLVDGDGTYPAAHAADLVRPVLGGAADMVVGSRLERRAAGSLRATNLVGNHALSAAIGWVGRQRLRDALSGYRALSRSLVAALPAAMDGFEVETVITLEALRAGRRVREVPVRYLPRPAGSSSKLRPWRDGWRLGRVVLRYARRD